MMMMTSPLRATSSALAQGVADVEAMLSGSLPMVLTNSWWPALMRCSAMGAPMMPSPMNPIFIVVLSLDAFHSAVERGALGVKFPSGNQVLHGGCVVARSKAVLLVEPVRLFHLCHVELDAEAGCLRHLYHAALDAQRLLRQALAVLPDPVGVDRRHAARRGGAHVRKHRQ